MAIGGFGLLELGLRIRKVGRQIGLEGGFVAFDYKERIGVLCTQEVPELTVGVEGIKGADSPPNRQGGQQFSRLGDFIGFFADRELGPHFLALVGKAGKQMGRISFLG
jgi:hypothetical protein